VTIAFGIPPATGVGLDAPSDATEEGLLVVRAGLLAEDLAVLVLEMPGSHLAQALDLLADGPGT
jgi:hypothetical protein